MADTGDGMPAGVPTITDAMWDRWLAHPGPVKFTVVHTGLKHTRESVIRPQLRRMEAARSVRDFVLAYSAAYDRWEAMDIFRTISYKLCPDPAGGGGVLATVVLVEKREQSVGVNVTREDARTTPEVHFSDNNVFGRAWEARLQAEGPLPSHRQVSLTLRNKNPPLGRWLQGRLFNRFRTSDYHTLRTEHTRGLTAGLQLAPSAAGSHLLEVGYEVRDAQPAKEQDVSDALRTDRGELERAYLRHEWTFTRWRQAPSSLLPAGLSVWLANEVGAIVRTLRHDVKAELHLPLARGLGSLSLHARLGLVTDLQGGRVHVNDRYFLDSVYVRGFRAIGPGAPDVFHPPDPTAGPRELTGGNVLGALSASLNFALPRTSLFTGHLFLNAGNLSYTEDRRQIFSEQFVRRFADSSSRSFGFGVLCRLLPPDCGRLEINVAVPFRDLGAPLWRPPANAFIPFRFGIHWTNT